MIGSINLQEEKNRPETRAYTAPSTSKFKLKGSGLRYNLKFCYKRSTQNLLTHLLSGLRSIQTFSVTLSATSLLPAGKGFRSKILRGGGQPAFQHSTAFHKTAHPTLMAGDHRDWSTAPLTQLSSFLFTLSYPFFLNSV